MKKGESKSHLIVRHSHLFDKELRHGLARRDLFATDHNNIKAPEEHGLQTQVQR
jgi:hypothetical protein